MRRRRRRGESDEDHAACFEEAHRAWQRAWRVAEYTNVKARKVSETARFLDGLLTWCRYWLGQPDLEAPPLCLDCALDLMASASRQTKGQAGQVLTMQDRQRISAVWAVRKLTRAADRERRRRR